MGTQMIQVNEENVYIKSLKGEYSAESKSKNKGVNLNNVKVNNTYSIPPKSKAYIYFSFSHLKKKVYYNYLNVITWGYIY